MDKRFYVKNLVFESDFTCKSSLLSVVVVLFLGTASSDGLVTSGVTEGEPSGANGSSGEAAILLVLLVSKGSSAESLLSTSASYFHNISIISRS